MPDDLPRHPLLQPHPQAIDGLRDVGRMFWQRGWSVGTSSNYSVVLGQDPLRICVTASGMDKGRLAADDFVIVDEEAKPIDASLPRPSAETHLHVVLGQQPGVGSILHTHSPWGTILSDLFFEEGGFKIDGYEMLKGLEGIGTHQSRVWVEIFENTQDIPDLARQVSRRLHALEDPLQYGFLIRRHGLYTWGRTLAEARRHVEIFEFFFEVLGRRLTLNPTLLEAARAPSMPV